MTITALLMLTVMLRAHPYDQKWVNCAEGLILLDIVLIAAYFLDNHRLLSTANNDIAVVLFILPFIYFVLYSLIKISWYVAA